MIKTVSFRSELDEFEHHNIENAIIWTLKKKFKPEQILSREFVCELHERMYGEVWKWAGSFRKTNKNIGVDKFQIETQLKHLHDDAKYWIEKNTYENDELVIRYKHKLVSIHCFPNGNGRHSRLMADVFANHIFNKPVFTWGGNQLVQQENIRLQYLDSLRAADAGNIQPLIKFARS
jgi:Fic-DOC domain mobile mystery protein B